MCHLDSRGSPTRSAARKSVLATSTLPTRGPRRGRKCYLTPAFLGVPNAKRGVNQKWLPHACLPRGLEQGKIAVENVPSRGSLTPSEARKSVVATSPLASRGPTRGRKCHLRPALVGVRNTKRGEKIRSGYLNRAFSGAKKRAEVVRNPCMLGGPQRQAPGEIRNGLPHPCLRGPEKGGSATQPVHARGSPTPSVGRKSEVATSSMTSGGPRRGRKCYVTAAFSELPNDKRWKKIRPGYLIPALSGAQKRVELLGNPCILGVPKRGAQGENLKWLPHPCLLGGQEEGGSGT